jgi:YVTN family beta-propeller protein
VSTDPATHPARPEDTSSMTKPATGWFSRRIVQLSWIGALALVVLAVPATAVGIAGGFSSGHGTRVPNAPSSSNDHVGGHPAYGFHPALADQALPATTGDYDAYVAAAGGDEVLELDVSTATIVNAFSADTAEGVAVTPDNSQVFIAETGQYDVIPVNVASGKEGTPIKVGAYPQDVAVSPDGSTVYATLTGGDSGPGGSNQVAVISTATDAVIGYITVGTGPRQVAFSPDGTRAYVTTERGVSVIDTASGSVVATIAIPSGAQGLAVSPDGGTVYATSPQSGRLVVIETATDHIVADIPAGAEPYAVAVTPDGSTAYVADMNSDSVEAIDTATDQKVATIPVGQLPGSIAITPDGSQVWVGNILNGDITVISPATNTVAGTISGAPGVPPPPAGGTATLDGAPLGIAFVGS